MSTGPRQEADFRYANAADQGRGSAQSANWNSRPERGVYERQHCGYLLHLVRDRQLARTSVNQVSSVTRFLICEVLGQADRRSQIPMPLTPQRLPGVLSLAEVAAVLAAPMSLKARTLLMTDYATGMRVSELCNLRGCDFDSSPDRICIRVVASAAVELIAPSPASTPPARIWPNIDGPPGPFMLQPALGQRDA